MNIFPLESHPRGFECVFPELPRNSAPLFWDMLPGELHFNDFNSSGKSYSRSRSVLGWILEFFGLFGGTAREALSFHLPLLGLSHLGDNPWDKGVGRAGGV